MISKLKAISGKTYSFHVGKDYGYICTSCLSSCVTISDTFDLWMNQSGFDTFSLVVNFIHDAWVFKHVIIRIFETPNFASVTLAKIVKPLFVKF